MQPYVPQIYSIGSRSRYWPYGAPYIRTPIPGAGFQGRRMVYAEQPLLLGATPSSTGTAPRLRAAALRLLQNPQQRFVVACKGQRTVTVRGYERALDRAGRMARAHRRTCYVTLPALLRRSIPLPLSTVRPSGEIVAGDTALGGLGQDIDPGRAATVVANLLIDPERELSVRGEALAQALDRHVATPLVESMGRQMQPYFWRYVFPPLLILYAITSVAAIKAWQAEARLASR